MAIQGIFYSWEKMRILFNFVLLIESMYLISCIRGFWQEISADTFLVNAVFSVLGANFCYMIGPLVESYFTWIGLHFRPLRYLIFLVGLAFSIVAVYVIFSTLDWNINSYGSTL